MHVFRIAKKRYAADLSGAGARMAGGRWNFKGTPVIYTSESRALAFCEFFIHVSPAFIPGNLKIVTVNIPDDIQPETVDRTDLPADWRNATHSYRSAQIGTVWLQSRTSLLLRVPSAVIPEEHNILINPIHNHLHLVRIESIDDFHIEERYLELKKSQHPESLAD
jgi:RES domain-containing protein